MRSITSERGVAIVSVILMLTFLMAIAATVAVSVNMDTRLRGAFAQSATGFYAAEAGLNKGMGDYKNLFLNFRVPTGSDFNTVTLTVGSRTVNYQLTSLAGNPQTVTIPSGQVFSGLNAIQYIYNAGSQAGKISGDTEASVGAEFLVGYIPLFQFVAFYANDLEILPGADMHLHGRVHTNGNLYLNSDAHLYIEDNPPKITTVQISTKGDIYRGRKDDQTCGGAVTVDMLKDADHNGNLDPKDLTCTGSSLRKVPISELAQWNGGMVSQIQSISVPQPDITAKGTGVYWTNADLRIVLRLDQTTNVLPKWLASCPATGCPLYVIEAQDASGNQDTAKTALLQTFMASFNIASSQFSKTRPLFYSDVPKTGPNTAAISYDPDFASDTRVYKSDMTGDADYRRGGFYNQREKKWVYLLNINLADLLQWNFAQPSTNRLFDPADTTDGGLVIYATVQGQDSTGINNYGVRIFGSRDLKFPTVASGGDPTGVTVVSDQPIYVQGDYNAGTAAGGTLPKQPAAIIGDSINILSNNYFQNNFSSTACVTNDCQSVNALADSSRNATSTTINSAFLAGVDATTANGGRSTYNGGLENYPRFHENWSGDTLTYAGSFVSLGTPTHVNGAWCGTGNTCNIYNPPTRVWDYDSAFNDVRNLPPLTPRFVYVQQVLFTEDFK